MKYLLRIFLLVCLTLSAWAEPVVATTSDLKKMVENMGYACKELSPEKFEFKISRNDLDIYVGSEVTPSKRYVWLTVSFGEYKDESPDKSKPLKLLQANGDIQPCQYYVTKKNFLMMGLPIENKDISPALLNERIDKVVSAVSDTWDLHKKP